MEALERPSTPPAATSSPSEVKEPKTLREIIQSLMLVDLDRDPEVVELDAERLRGQLKGKVDDVNRALEFLEAMKNVHEKRIEQERRSIDAYQRNIQGLKSYVVFEMQKEGLKKLPGNRWRFNLMESERLSYDRNATADDFFNLGERFPDLVEQKTSYQFNWGEVQRLDKAGDLPEGIASKKPTAPFIRVYANRPQKPQKSAKAKKEG